MLLSVAAWGFVPYVFHETSTGDPRNYMAMQNLLFALVVSLLLVVQVRRSPGAADAVRRALHSPRALLSDRWLWTSIVCQMNLVFFLWAIRRIDTAVATLIHNLWPLWFVLLAEAVRRFSTPRRRGSIPPSRWALMLLSVPAVALVVASQGGEDSSSLLEGLTDANLVGVGISLSGGATAACGIFAAVAAGGSLMQRAGSTPGASAAHQQEARYALTLLTLAVSRAVSVLYLAVPSSFNLDYLGGDYLTPILHWGPVLAGLVAGSGEAALVWANHRADDPAINNIFYLTPAVSIALLWGFGAVSVARVDYLLVGSVAAILINMLLHSRAATPTPARN